MTHAAWHRRLTDVSTPVFATNCSASLGTARVVPYDVSFDNRSHAEVMRQIYFDNAATSFPKPPEVARSHGS